MIAKGSVRRSLDHKGSGTKHPRWHMTEAEQQSNGDVESLHEPLTTKDPAVELKEAGDASSFATGFVNWIDNF